MLAEDNKASNSLSMFEAIQSIDDVIHNSKGWTARLTDMNYYERVYWRQHHLSAKAIRKSWSSSQQESLIKHILEALQIAGVGPLGLFQTTGFSLQGHKY